MPRVSFLIIFLIIVILDLYQVSTQGEMRLLTKPLIMISLIIYYGSHYRYLDPKRSTLMFFLALLAAWAGDILLIWDHLFIWGLIAFLTMQLLYSISFGRDRMMSRSIVGFAVGLVLTTGLVGYLLWPTLGELRWPVIIYMIAISTMCFGAAARDRGLSGYRAVLIGTLLFVVSDTVLAVHQFTANLNLGRLTVMITYTAAQYLIVQGYIDGSLRSE